MRQRERERERNGEVRSIGHSNEGEVCANIISVVLRKGGSLSLSHIEDEGPYMYLDLGIGWRLAPRRDR